MSNLARIISILSLLILGSVLLFAQPDFGRFKEHLKRIEAERRARPVETRKLLGALYDILKLAEAADTSKEKQKELALVLGNRALIVDAEGRLTVTLRITSWSKVAGVTKKIDSLGGIVDQTGPLPCYMICRVHPKHLRSLTLIQSIRTIEETRDEKTD